jgi:hypothetical protein
MVTGDVTHGSGHPHLEVIQLGCYLLHAQRCKEALCPQLTWWPSCDGLCSNQRQRWAATYVQEVEAVEAKACMAVACRPWLAGLCAAHAVKVNMLCTCIILDLRGSRTTCMSILVVGWLASIQSSTNLLYCHHRNRRSWMLPGSFLVMQRNKSFADPALTRSANQRSAAQGEHMSDNRNGGFCCSNRAVIGCMPFCLLQVTFRTFPSCTTAEPEDVSVCVELLPCGKNLEARRA